jgi:hypothetical protein
VKKYVMGLLLLVVHNICAMEKEVTTLLKKYSRNPNKKIRISADHLIPMRIHQRVPFDVQRNVFGMMYEKYSAEKERFITAKVREIYYFVDRGNRIDWRIKVQLKDDYESLLKNDLRALLFKAEHHSFRQKQNKDKALEVYGCNYIKNVKQLENYNDFPVKLNVINMRRRIKYFVKKHYDPIILFWYIVHTKQGYL